MSLFFDISFSLYSHSMNTSNLRNDDIQSYNGTHQLTTKITENEANEINRKCWCCCYTAMDVCLVCIFFLFFCTLFGEYLIAWKYIQQLKVYTQGMTIAMPTMSTTKMENVHEKMLTSRFIFVFAKVVY